MDAPANECIDRRGKDVVAQVGPAGARGRASFDATECLVNSLSSSVPTTASGVRRSAQFTGGPTQVSTHVLYDLQDYCNLCCDVDRSAPSTKARPTPKGLMTFPRLVRIIDPERCQLQGRQGPRARDSPSTRHSCRVHLQSRQLRFRSYREHKTIYGQKIENIILD